MTSRRTLPMINVDASAPRPDLTVVRDLQVLPAPTTASRHVMGLLAGGVPLSLLFDLADPAGPPSGDIASSEPASGSLLGDLMTFRARAAEGAGPGAKARAALRTLQLG